MKYISEERLRNVLECTGYEDEDIELLLAECQELNPWQPIDENAPKDREIAVYCQQYQDLQSMVSKCKWHESAGFCVDELRQPTMWVELPEPPK